MADLPTPESAPQPPPTDVRLKAALFWLRVAWLAAVGICITQHFTVNITNNREYADWGIIFVVVIMVTATYFLLNAVVRNASVATRKWLSLAAALATALLVVFTALLGLFAAWAYNPLQYAALVLFNVASWRFAKWL